MVSLSRPFSFFRPMRPFGILRHAGLMIIVLLVAASVSYADSGSKHPLIALFRPEERMNSQASASFYDVLQKALKKRKLKVENICPGSDAVARRVLEDYGAIFIAKKSCRLLFVFLPAKNKSPNFSRTPALRPRLSAKMKLNCSLRQ